MALAACGNSHTTCVDDNGNVWSFGTNNFGQLGQGENFASLESYQPRKIEALKEIKSVSAGFFHTICLDRSGQLWSFGIGVYGQLGNNSTSQQESPVSPLFHANVIIKSFCCGYNHTVCVDESDQCWSFGQNDHGQLGLGTRDNVSTPQLIEALSDTPIASVACKAAFSLFLDFGGNVKSVGDNKYGQLGIENKMDVNIPVDVPHLKDIEKMAAGYHSSLFLDASGNVYVCGKNDNGQLGLGREIRSLSTPTLLPNLPSICEIECGYNYSMFVDVERNLWACGENRGFGFCDDESVFVPKKIPNIELVTSVSRSTYHTLVKQSNGEIIVFGKNDSGQLGIKNKKQITSPEPLDGYSHIIGNPIASRAKSARK